MATEKLHNNASIVDANKHFTGVKDNEELIFVKGRLNITFKNTIIREAEFCSQRMNDVYEGSYSHHHLNHRSELARTKVFKPSANSSK